MRLGLQVGPLISSSTQYLVFRDIAPFMRFWSGPPNAAPTTPDQTTYRASLLPASITAGYVLKGILDSVPEGEYKVTVEPVEALVDSEPKLVKSVLTVTSPQPVTLEFIVVPSTIRIEQAGQGIGMLSNTASALLEPFAGGVLRFMVAQRLNSSNPHDCALHHKQASYQWPTAGMMIDGMMEICHETHMHPWFCLSPVASENEVRAFIEHVAKIRTSYANLYGYGLKRITLENGHEIWNGTYPWAKHYRQTLNPAAPSSVKWPEIMAAHVERTAAIGRIAKEVLGENYHVTLGVQSASNVTCPSTLPGGIDGIAIAPYLNPPEGFAGDLKALFDAMPEAIERQRGYVTYWRARAKTLGVSLDIYESGQHFTQKALDPTATPEQKSAYARLEALYTEANHDPHIVEVYEQYYDMLEASVSVEAPVIAHCWIKEQTSGNFGLLESVTDATSYKWNALQNVLARQGDLRHWLARAGIELQRGNIAEAGAVLCRAGETNK